MPSGFKHTHKQIHTRGIKTRSTEYSVNISQKRTFVSRTCWKFSRNKVQTFSRAHPRIHRQTALRSSYEWKQQYKQNSINPFILVQSVLTKPTPHGDKKKKSGVWGDDTTNHNFFGSLMPLFSVDETISRTESRGWKKPKLLKWWLQLQWTQLKKKKKGGGD